jgi:hypothetical protein
MRRLILALAVTALVIASGGLAVASNWGGTPQHAGKKQYGGTPGCDREYGHYEHDWHYKGGSWKYDNRRDCPKPPGECWKLHYGKFWLPGHGWRTGWHPYALHKDCKH